MWDEEGFLATTLERTAEMSGVSPLTVSREIVAESKASARSLEARFAALPAPEDVTLLDRDDRARARGVDPPPTAVGRRPAVLGAGETDLLIDVIDNPSITNRRVYGFDPARPCALSSVRAGNTRKEGT